MHENRVVMVIEDDDVVRQLIAEILGEAGYLVLSCAGAEQALATLETTTPELITLDLAMPSMDGAQFLRLLRRQPATARVPVVVVTAAIEPLRRQMALEETEVVPKPFTVDRLLQAVQDAMAGQQPAI